MSDSIKATACAGLAALVIGCGVFAPPSAYAEAGDPVRFAFAYDVDDLATAEGRKATGTRLSAEAAKQCRVDFGVTRSLSALRQCREELVSAVQDALDSRMAGHGGGCIAVAFADVRATPRSCTHIEYAMNMEPGSRARN